MFSSAGAPQYDRTLFVNRKTEIDLVTKKAREMSLGQSVRERTMIFWGYKGTGRTWLLKHLEDVLPDLNGVHAYYLDLEEWATASGKDQAVQKIIAHLVNQARKWLDRSVGNPTGKQILPGKPVVEPLADIWKLLSSHVLVLLLDHVYESDQKLLELLEEHCLALLAVQPHILLVMAGRGQAYHWKTPELRLYVEDYHPKPFDESLTERQLEKQQPAAVPRTSEIYELSQGYPLGNYLLATQSTVKEGMHKTVDSLLEGVPAEERSWLEAVCILRTFDEERLPPLLAAYFDDPTILQWSYKEIRQRRDRLQQTRMIRWNEEAGGWKVDQAIRPVLERYLQETKLDDWRRLHCAAYRVYREWEQAYPDQKQRWQDEAEHHAKCLSDAGYDSDQCPPNS